MTHTARNRIFQHPDRRVVVYSGLFMACAGLSALGLGEHALLAFFPAAAATELLTDSEPADDNRVH